MAVAIPESHVLPIDDTLIAALERGDTSVAAEITPERGRFHVEVISDPWFDLAPDATGEAGAADFVSATRFVRRWQRLREPFQSPDPDLLVVRGALRAEVTPGELTCDEEAATFAWAETAARLTARGQRLLHALDTPQSGADEFAAVFVVVRSEREREAMLDMLGAEPPLAVIAVVSVDGGEACAGEGLQRLVTALTRSLASNVPLHTIVVSVCSVPSEKLLQCCERLRVGLLLAGSREGEEVRGLSRTTMLRGSSVSEVAVVACPAFTPGTGRPGLMRVRVDTVKGEAAIAFRYDLGSDMSPAPVQLVRPLPSVSRVSSSERRLYEQVRRRTAEALDGGHDQAPRVEEFARHVRRLWEQTGYAALCEIPEPHQAPRPFPLPETRHTTYHLLMLLRERGGGYDILLSNHSPMRPSPLSDWNVFLMPAFKNVRNLLEHLRDDVLRQATERPEDFEHVAHAEAFEQAVASILDGGEDDLWADQLRELAQTTIRKISPTTGAVTEFKYHAVTLLPLIDRNLAKSGDAGDDESRNARQRIVAWLKSLDCVWVPRDREQRGLPIESLESDGAALRWDPAAMLSDLDADAEARRRAQQAYPGVVWFPLTTDEGDELWRRCPAIVARNADVMSWISGELDRRRVDGVLPDELLLGHFAGGSEDYRVECRYPFEGVTGTPNASDPEEQDVHGSSTVAALSKVRFTSEFDLGEELAYEGARFKRVWLERRPMPERAGREAIFVFAANPDERTFGEDADPRQPLGVLRPVQRYVLTAGLQRVQELDYALRVALGESGDPWGFVRVRKGGAPKRVSVTPPIIEQLHLHDADPKSTGTDFVVCDGNHRIVELAWKGKRPVAAVAVVGELNRPYYAHPFGALEWNVTAANELVVSPDASFKYSPREVEDVAVRSRFPGREKLLFRRYFRDLETGFGYVGGQGGKFA
jgi:hypothetical protein